MTHDESPRIIAENPSNAITATPMRILLILIVASWGIVALLTFATTAQKSRDAKLTAGYLVLWPVLAVALFLNEPVPLWLAVPTFFGFLPWFLAGPHLYEILKDPSRSRPDEIIGIPRSYWKWGGIGAILLGVAFDGFVYGAA
ncbi:hypothetical protein ThimaDRAFT_4621 [Thiocapsa marina 5811]|uniref:Uncharacterized protein n=2 Tax=Thiocapsa marina TaxID=244573 RepID=F9UI68_9GAMM|nr:hypothetical protein ThimaDRAFT_4621 [Thiocapsa marina 5811]